jgi:hypothetical protein
MANSRPGANETELRPLQKGQSIENGVFGEEKSAKQSGKNEIRKISI